MTTTGCTNVACKVEKNRLIIDVDVSDKVVSSAPISKSGKSKIGASTNGFVSIRNVKLGLDVIST
jgi:hypothetical protein